MCRWHHYECVVSDLPGTYASVGYMSHASIGVAVVLEQTLQLPLLHAWTYGPHHLTVGSAAHFISIAQHCQFSRSLDHSADRCVRMCVRRGRERRGGEEKEEEDRGGET